MPRSVRSDLDLSLTGSQLSSARRSATPTATRNRPTSSTGVKTSATGRDKRLSSSSNTKDIVKNGSTAGVTAGNKHERGGSLNLDLASHRSTGSDDSTAGNAARGITNTKNMLGNTTDYLALFDTKHKPIIKNKNSKKAATRNSSHYPMRVFPIPTSGRSSSTVESEFATPFSSALNSARTAATESDTTQEEEEGVDPYPRTHLLNSATNVGGPRKPTRLSTTNILYSSNSNLEAAGSGQPGAPPLQGGSTNRSPLAASLSEDDWLDPRRASLAEDYIARVNWAAVTIQRGYRGYRRRQGERSAAAARQLLQGKRRQKQEELERERLGHALSVSQRSALEKKRAREDKARQARQAAIQELQKKRQEKKVSSQRIAEEEVRSLQASGRVGKRQAARPGSGVKKRLSGSGGSEGGPEGATHRPSTASSVGRKVDEIFQSFSPGDSGVTREGADDGAASTVPLSTANTKTTLDDLLDTIKLLEETEKLPSPESKKDKQKTDDWFEALEREARKTVEEKPPAVRGSGGGDPDERYLSAENLQQLNQSQSPSQTSSQPPPPMATHASTPAQMATQNALLTEDKLRSIMSFLDEVDLADQRKHEEEEQRSERGQRSERSEGGGDSILTPLVVPSAWELAKMEQASAAASEITNTVLSQRLQLEEKERTVKMLQKALNQQRELTVRHAKEQDKESKHRLQIQKDEYETTIKRHLTFIDQLIDDKKALGDKCDKVVHELKDTDQKYSSKIKHMAESHSMELKKMKDTLGATEKIRREKWIDEKTKKIKEITVKGLEPEIQKLIAKHKAEVKKLKSIHEAELLQGEERAGVKYVKHIEELRDQLAAEKEAACARERELAKQRYEKQLEQEEASLQQQRRRLYAEIHEEKERLGEQARRQRQENDRLQTQLESGTRKAGDLMRTEYEKARDEQERRHAAELREIEERLKIEKEAWEENYMKKQETWLLSRERELKEEVKRERDKEIELVIGRLEEDNTSAREEAERTAESRVKRIRDKYESELKEVERSERNTQERLNQVKMRLGEVEGENVRLKGLINQKEEQINDVKQECDRLIGERRNVQDVVRQEFADRLVSTEEENKRLKTEMSEMRARHKLEIQRIQTEKEEEMEEVHKRVKSAIVKKEETVKQLREQHAAALKRADHLESLLEQQRKQLLKK